MKNKGTLAYLAIFAVLTWMTWSPLGYGSYGEPGRTFGMPTWAVIALLAGAALFVVEWIFLFYSGLALEDEEVREIVVEISRVEDDSAAKDKVVGS